MNKIKQFITFLDKVPEGRYFLNAAPLNLGGADGAPCRAYLIDWEEAKCP